ncbi:antitoxin protein of toxin-antitoxin system [Streptomyces sp. 3211.6]|uniref:antitoxin n=1 Tax=Streptomyces TaxID=1883 RepID=UPI0009A4F4EC|nr:MULTISPECIES: antitoxin [Streptomyces]RKT02501.1 antitoxin protein of toxin-antitoxin system [Streptomyces sp. 3211.6]RPF43825.1 antitoxin protein of toxin-antitoxin system [Streptomyces sp. Ag109_G2-6]
MSIVDKLKGMLGQHPDKAKEAVERGGDMIDERTGGKYTDKVDMGQEKANEFIDRDRPQQS